jgi:hypothetical protein
MKQINTEHISSIKLPIKTMKFDSDRVKKMICNIDTLDFLGNTDETDEE